MYVREGGGTIEYDNVTKQPRYALTVMPANASEGARLRRHILDAAARLSGAPNVILPHDSMEVTLSYRTRPDKNPRQILNQLVELLRTCEREAEERK